MDKVLIAAPTADVKNYCLNEWYENVLSFNHPNTKVFLADNSKTNKNVKHLRSIGIESEWTEPNGSIISTMAKSHNACRDYAIRNNYTWWLHLETDVFPPSDIIEKLMCYNRGVVGAPYHSYEGIDRALVVQDSFEYSKGDGRFQVLSALNNYADSFLDGTLKKVYHIGLGCVLIHKSVFQDIKFRSEKGVDLHPDSYFATDCFSKGIGIYVATDTLCVHKNKAWGVHGVDYK